MPYVGENILVGQGDILDCVKSHCPTAIITAGEFELVAAVVKKVLETDPDVWDPDAEDKLAVELQTQTGEAIHLPGKAPLVVLTEASEARDWFYTPAGAPHLEKEAGAQPPAQIWVARYQPATNMYVENIQVPAHTEWQARLAVAKALSEEPEAKGGKVYGYCETSVPACRYYWMSYTHSTFSIPPPKPLEVGKVTFHRGNDILS